MSPWVVRRLVRTDTVTAQGTPAVDQINKAGTFVGHKWGLSHGHAQAVAQMSSWGLSTVAGTKPVPAHRGTAAVAVSVVTNWSQRYWERPPEDRTRQHVGLSSHQVRGDTALLAVMGCDVPDATGGQEAGRSNLPSPTECVQVKAPG